MDTIRTFIAITLPGELTGRLKELQDVLKGAVREAGAGHSGGARDRKTKKPVSWTSPEGIHLTIKFLGDIDPKKVDSIASALELASGGIHPFGLIAGGGETGTNWVGGFPNLVNPRVVFTPLSESEELAALHEKVERELESLGFVRENRAFHPHLTLARVKSAHAGRAIGEAAKGIDAGDPIRFTVTEFSLIKSVLGPNGASYTRLKTIHLNRNNE